MFKSASFSKIKSTFILQQSPTDSGVTCLASLINYHGGDFSINIVRELSNSIKEGPTLLGLYHAAQQLGYDAEGLQATSAKDLTDFNETAILHVIIKNSKHHFLVYYGYYNGQLLLGDPARGIVTYSYEELDKIWQSKSLLKLKPNDSFIKRKVEKGKKKKFFFELIKGDLPILVATAFLGIATSLVAFFAVLNLKDLIDEILSTEAQENILVSIGFSALLFLACSALIYIKNILGTKHRMNLNNRLVEKFYSKLLQLPKSFFDLKNTEFITHKNDVRIFQFNSGALLNNTIADVFRVVVFLTIAFVYSSTIGFFTLISIPVHFLIQYLFNGKLVRIQKKLMTNRALADTHYAESINSITTIKSLTKEDVFIARHNEIYHAFQKKYFLVNGLNNRFAFLSQVSSMVLFFAVLGLLAQMMQIKSITNGELMILVFASATTIYGLHKLALATSVFQEARLVFNKLYDFINIKSEHYNSVSFPDQLSFFKEDFRMKFKNISFRFPGRKKLLRSISFKVKRGEMIAVLGESGSGKSTIIQILQKFYKPKAGKIEVNSIDLAKIQAKSWRSVISVVPQEIKIFNNTLLYNLTLSNKPDDMDEAIEFCQHYGFDKFFELLPHSYVTMLGNDGINISGAQRQLIGLARALYRKPELLLLDEVTGSMDPKTEKFVFELLGRLKSAMATIIVTNQATIAQKADRIYLLEKGELSNFGSPHALMLTENIFSGSIRRLAD